jgi:SNF2 family DNA or RNA helicase
VIIAGCGHSLCSECHVDVLQTRQCPICRGPMIKEELIPIAQFQKKFAPVEVKVEENQHELTRFANHSWPSSTKIDRLVDILKTIRRERPGEKCIVFSQFLGFLALLDKPLKEAGIAYGRFDGSVSAQVRNGIVKKFAQDKEMNVMLLSQKVLSYLYPNSTVWKSRT